MATEPVSPQATPNDRAQLRFAIDAEFNAIKRDIRAAESVLSQRTRFGESASQAGYAFPDATGGTFKRDLFKELGFPRTLAIKQYRDRYRRGGIAKRLVSAPTKASWPRDIRLQEDEDPKNETEFEKASAELAQRLEMWPRLLRADTLASLGRYSVLLIGAAGELNEELPKFRDANEVLYLTPLAEDNAVIKSIESDTANPRFGLPTEYDLSLGGDATTGRQRGKIRSINKTAHWTRVIHLAQGLLEDDVYGTPTLESVWNDLDNLVKLVGGGSEAAWKRADPGMHLKFPFVDAADESGVQIEYGEEEEQKVLDELQDFRHGLSRVLRTRGVEVDMLDGGVFTFSTNASTVLDLISATSEIPKRILLGSERGELASTQDRSNWADRVAERRTDFGEPSIRVLIDRLIEHGALPEPKDGYEVIYPDLDQMNDGEKAALSSTMASANKAQSDAEGRIIMTSDEMREVIFGLDPLGEEESRGKAEPNPDADLDALVAAGEDLDDDVHAAVHRKTIEVAEQHEPRFERAFRRAFLKAKASVDLVALQEAFKFKNRDNADLLLAQAVATIGETLDEELPAELAAAGDEPQ